MSQLINWDQPREDLEWEIAKWLGWTKAINGQYVSPAGKLYRKHQTCPWMRITHDLQSAVTFATWLGIKDDLVINIITNEAIFIPEGKDPISFTADNPALSVTHVIMEHLLDK